MKPKPIKIIPQSLTTTEAEMEIAVIAFLRTCPYGAAPLGGSNGLFFNLPSYIALTPKDREPSRTRPTEQKWWMKVRNVHRSGKRNGLFVKQRGGWLQLASQARAGHSAIDISLKDGQTSQRSPPCHDGSTRRPSEDITMSVVQLLRPDFTIADPASMTLDLENQRPKEVLALVEAFEADIKAKPELGPLPVKTGWNEISPIVAVDLLRRNRPGANRKIDPATVFYYARQMAKGEWKATGQPFLIDENGILLDCQHRCYAVIISGATIKSYVVTNVEALPLMFAYIDNSRPRTAATALQTAGLNGVSAVIAKIIRIGEEVRLGIYNPTGPVEKLQRMSPADVLKAAGNYPNAQKAARSASSDWSDAVKYLGDRKEVVAYLGMRIIDVYGEELADDFFEAVIDTSDRPSDDPIAALRKEIDKDNRAEKPMKKQHMLGALIKAFNAWHKHEPLGRRWMLLVNEDFPKLDEGETQQADAAE